MAAGSKDGVLEADEQRQVLLRLHRLQPRIGVHALELRSDRRVSPPLAGEEEGWVSCIVDSEWQEVGTRIVPGEWQLMIYPKTESISEFLARFRAYKLSRFLKSAQMEQEG